MVNEKNIQLIENKKAQIEEVQELKETEQERKVRESYEAEFDSYGNIGVNKSYGPGNNMSSDDKGNLAKGITGVASGVGIAALTVACPPAGLVTAATVGGIGAGAKIASNFTPKDSGLHEVLDAVGDTYMIAGSVGVAPSSARYVKNVASGKIVIK
jgi:hypothetical protein